MNLLDTLSQQMETRLKGGIYHRTQVDFAYNSNHMEGSRLTAEQTRYIFETNTVGVAGGGAVNVDDVIEAKNHFRCVDYIIAHAREPLSEDMVKRLHYILKAGTSDADREWFAVGEYKRLPNEVGGIETVAPEQVAEAMAELLAVGLDDILDFHRRFEAIHPFQDGNGRVGRLVMFKECLRFGIVPFIITDDLKMFYHLGLREWPQVREYLRDTSLTAQDSYKTLLGYFRVDC